MLDQQIPFQNMYNELFDQNADSETILAMNHTLNGLKLYGADRFIEKFDEFGKDTIGFNPKNLWDYQAQGNVYYTDHHLAHAAHTFLSSGYEESDIFIIDGGGNMFRSIFVDSKKQEVVDLSDHLPLGWLWNVMTKIGDFGVLQEGKLMGLCRVTVSSTFVGMRYSILCLKSSGIRQVSIGQIIHTSNPS
jgi:predicted NodU family carbamoyl transferase